MFTGIVEQRGRVRAACASSAGRRLLIDPMGWSHVPAPGDSIAVNGCCLTATEPATGDAAGGGALLRFDIVPQTLALTTLGTLDGGDEVNLEHAATAGTLLGGHIVQGHVDGVGRVIDVRQGGDGHRVRIAADPAVMEPLAPQGSIAVDGVSLTIASLDESWFEVALIPTTLEVTTLGGLREGRAVNLEADYLVKSVIAWMKRSGAASSRLTGGA